MNPSNLTPESQELINILDKINVFNIYAVRFYPSKSKAFNVMTKNMKKIALVIIGKANKTEFDPGELKSIFDRIKAHLPDNIGPEKRKIIEDAVGNFVIEGGKVEIVTLSSRAGRELLVFISFFIISLGLLLFLCGGGIIIWIKSKLLFYISLLIYFIYFYFHSKFSQKIQTKLKEESIDLLPDTPIFGVLKNIGEATGTLILAQLFFGLLGILASLINPFK